MIRAAKERSDVLVEVCVTGQHRQMLDQILNFFEIVPDVDFSLMQPNQSLPALTSSVLLKVSEYLESSKPDYVVIQGDTTTVMATALAAFYAKIKVVHVEAGLRTGNMLSPYPEEMNRVVASRLTTIHCAPTKLSAANLAQEQVTAGVHITGNTVIDALLWTVNKIAANHPEIKGLPAVFFEQHKNIILITGHRRESFGAAFESICSAIHELAHDNPEFEFIYPVHLNPNVQEPVYRILGGLPNVHLAEPLDYPAFVYLMTKSYLILSDSGGVQEEAPSLGKPVVVMRENTERPEGIEAGVVKLAGTGKDDIKKIVQELINNEAAYKKMAASKNPYGDGQSAGRIMDIIAAHYEAADY